MASIVSNWVSIENTEFSHKIVNLWPILNVGVALSAKAFSPLLTMCSRALFGIHAVCLQWLDLLEGNSS